MIDGKPETSDGRIRLSFHGERRLASHVSWELHHGPMPEGMFVLHRCDNPPCVNSAHLFLGTHQDNAEDRDRKGHFVVLHGSLNGRARLDEDKVRAIKARINSGELLASIGNDYGMRKEVISGIKCGRSWKRVA